MIDKNHKQHWLKKRHSRSKLNLEMLTKGVLQGDISILSRALTLVESTKADDQMLAQDLIEALLPHTGKSIRIGITGVPGVGKSTFIESFGLYALSKKRKIAILAIDPSSEQSKGSILGDKTRMNKLSQQKNAFIRPSPSSGALGGVAKRTRESILLCEAFGFDLILVETVGVGQSETMVKEMVDFFLLLMLSGAGDELQGIKRGIMEMADIIVITKADGENTLAAKVARRNYQNALHLFPPRKSSWQPKARICSAYENTGMDEIWQLIMDYQTCTISNGFFDQNREQQELFWFDENIKQLLLDDFFQSKEMRRLVHQAKEKIALQQTDAFSSSKEIVHRYLNKKDEQ
jgi:LAO/AO transport system kinase